MDSRWVQGCNPQEITTEWLGATNGTLLAKSHTTRGPQSCSLRSLFFIERVEDDVLRSSTVLPIRGETEPCTTN
jgi:hypothetical protein